MTEKTSPIPQAGQAAPEFSLPDQDGTIHSLKDYRGKWVLLYFYPKDDTPGCTTQACGIRDAWSEFKKAGITVLGVSKDTQGKHQKFREKYDLPFTLLSDPDRTVIQKYGAVWEKKMFGKAVKATRRHSFLIDPEGFISEVFENVDPGEHTQKILAAMS